MNPIRMGVVMDPIAQIAAPKDTTLGILLEARQRGFEINYFEQNNLRILNGEPLGSTRRLEVRDDADDWFDMGEELEMRLADLDVIFMRKDPPFDTEYIYTTYILERAEEEGCLVVNRPSALRDVNEKAFTAWFPQCCPETLISRSIHDMRSFLSDHGEIVVKPLHGMGGRSIFVVRREDKNANVIFETLTDNESRHAMAQRYIPEISEGDKRIILVDGEPIGPALARIPSGDDHRGNLVMGALAEVRELTDRDRWICAEVGPVLKERGILFAGVDVIGDYLTEINVTSPTGIRELKKLAGVDLGADLMNAVEARLSGP